MPVLEPIIDAAVISDEDRATMELVNRETIGFGGIGAKLNWLRAAVLGANDGVVSGSGLVIGVAAVDPSNTGAIMLAGVAGLVAGAASMAMGEYISVSSQRDTEEALVAKERHDLEHTPEEEFEELVHVYRNQGLSEATARTVVTELTAHNPLAAHLRAEYGVHPEELTTPWHAALASAVAFTAGFVLPLSTMYVMTPAFRIPVTVGVALIGLFATGLVSSIVSGSSKTRPILRNVLGGAGAMALTWAIGNLFGVGIA